jgi:hypothetical protein
MLLGGKNFVYGMISNKYGFKCNSIFIFIIAIQVRFTNHTIPKVKPLQPNRKPNRILTPTVKKINEKNNKKNQSKINYR